MKEELLHFMWQNKLLYGKKLSTTDGVQIQIVHPGSYNRHSGPDFFNARLRIGETLWAGNVEMHTAASEWDKHRHTADAAYNNVILHVVYVADKAVKNAAGQTLPTLELRQFIPATLLQRYELMQQQRRRHLACEPIVNLPDTLQTNAWMQRMLVERIEAKTGHIKELLVATHHHYEQSFYILTARYFGLRINAQPFEQLAYQLPLTVLAKHKNSLHETVALVLGTSGLMEGMRVDDALKDTYQHLSRKYKLKALSPEVWKFGGTRPANFPNIRLIQFALFLHQSSHLLSKVIECESLLKVKQLYHLNGGWMGESFTLGEDAINLLLINSVLPFVFVYGKIQKDEVLCEKALNWYEAIPAENNNLVRPFARLGLVPKNAGDSQAFVQLKTEYCDQLRCLHCSIGFHSLVNV